MESLLTQDSGVGFIISDVALAVHTNHSTYPTIEFAKCFEKGITLAPDLTLRRFENDEAQAIMDACEPSGCDFRPTRQFAHYYALERSSPPGPDSYDWDNDQRITRTIAFSRWVYDSPFAFEYSARVRRTPARSIVKICPLKPWYHAFTSNPERTWLTPEEWKTVGDLIEQWPTSLAQRCERVGTAIWYREHLAREFYGEIRLVQLVTALESLISIWNRAGTRRKGLGSRGQQFCLGVLKLAAASNSLITKDEVNEAWSRRSAFVHADTLPNPTFESNKMIDPLYRKLQEVLDHTLVLLIQKDDFAANFENDDRVAQWHRTESV